MSHYRVAKSFILLLSIVFSPLSEQLNAQTRRGKLPNGLAYILRKQTSIKGKAEYRLVMKVGSCNEDDDERGVAHFLEHCFFAGNTKLSAEELQGFLKSCGISIGFGYNAFTTQDRTVYALSLPTKDCSAIDKINHYLRDNLLGLLRLDEEKLKIEQNIIKEELRAMVQNDLFYGLKLGNGLHSRRMPLGSVEDINAITSDKLRGFFDKWYKPNLATIVIVGDIDLDNVERSIKSSFASIRGKSCRAFREPTLTYPKGITIQREQDDLLASTKVELIFPHRIEAQNSLEALYRSALTYMAVKLWQSALVPIKSLHLSNSWYLSDTEHLTLEVEGKGAEVIQKKLKSSFSALASLQAKSSISQKLLSELIAKAKGHYSLLPEGLSSLEFCNYYIDELIHQDMVLENQTDVEALHKRLERVQWADLQKALGTLKLLISKRNALLTCLAPSTKEAKPLTGESIRQVIREGLADKSYAYEVKAREVEEERKVATPKVLAEPYPLNPEMTCQSRLIPTLDLEEVRLKNGIRLVLKETKDPDSLVRVSVISRGGLASIPKGLEMQLESAAGYLELGGVERIKRQDLEDYMFEHNMSMALTTSAYYSSIVASSKARDLGELLRLLKEKMLRPERAIADFEEVKAEMLQRVYKPNRLAQMVKRDKALQMQRYLDSLMGTEIPLKSAESKAEIKALNLDLMYKAHVKAFSSPRRLTILVVGTFDRAETRKRLISLFSSLPQQEEVAFREVFDAKTMPKLYTLGTSGGAGHEATLFNVYYASYRPSLRNHLMLKLARELVRSRLIKTLREEKGLVYSPYMYLEYRAMPKPLAYLKMETTLAQKNIDKANAIIRSFIQELRTKLVNPKELQDIKRTFLMNKREALTESNTSQWQTTLTKCITKGESLEDFASYEEILSSISPLDIRSFLSDFLSEERHLTSIIQ